MGGLSTLPVSGLEANWIQSTFRPLLHKTISSLSNGGIVWLHVDAGAEGDYLLTYAGSWAESNGRHVTELTVPEEDPFLLWRDFFGTMDEPGQTWSSPAGAILCVYNATVLPIRFLRERSLMLAAHCRAQRWVSIFPVLHEALPHVHEIESLSLHITVPRLAEIGRERITTLTEALVHAEFPSASSELKASLVEQIGFVDPPPASRTELQSWIDFYSNQEDFAAALRQTPPPPLPRQPKLPIDVPTIENLKSKLISVLETFTKASEGFVRVMGRRLFNIVIDPPNPFQASDPEHWFSATVSYLSCWLELADRALEPLTRYEYHGASGDLRVASPPPFFDLLRRLRTYMQHGLSPTSSTDKETVNRVCSWYYSVCGAANPMRHHWRNLTASFLEEAHIAANRLATNIEKLPSCVSRPAIESQIRIYARSLSKEEWRANVRSSIEALAPSLDPEALLEKHIGELQRLLRDAPLVLSEIGTKARELTDLIVSREATRCPVGPRDLLVLGIPPGPLVGLTMAKVDAEWQRDPTQSRDTLLEFARGLAAQVRGPSQQT